MLQVEENEQSTHGEKPLPHESSSIIQTERNMTGIELPVTGDISDEGRRKMCMALELEYMVYFRILREAENIGPKDIAEAKKLAQTNCPNLDFHSMLAD